jgi:cysteine-rich repeat protein
MSPQADPTACSVAAQLDRRDSLEPAKRALRFGGLLLRTLVLPWILSSTVSCVDLIAPIDAVVTACSAEGPACPATLFCFDGLCLRSSVPRCGDGVVQAETEECDDGNDDASDRCAACRVTYCGDGIAQHSVGEACDDGNHLDSDACTADCAWARCGDAVKRTDSSPGSPNHEDCDDGNDEDHDRCTNDCLAARCGDGWVLDGVEYCDDGNETDDDSCSNTCGLGVVEVASGQSHTCARTERGRVQCWGDNAFGQLGDGSRNVGFSPVVVPQLDGVQRLFINNNTSCALRDDHSVWCWGEDVGLNPIRYGGQRSWMDVTSFIYGNFQRVYGLDSDGQLFRLTPGAASIILHEDEPMQILDGGADHACTLGLSGRVYCFGANRDGYLGLAGDRVLAPTPIPGLENIVDIAALSMRTCALNNLGQLLCWGRSFGGLSVLTSTPSLMPEIPAAVAIWGNREALMVRLASGELYVADVFHEQFYRHDAQESSFFGPFMPQAGARGYNNLQSASARPEWRCAVNDKRRVSCWGQYQKGRLGMGMVEYFHTPQRILNLGGAEEVVVGARHTCARLSGGSVRCWGRDESNQRGSRVALPSKTPPSLVYGLQNTQHLTSGLFMSCALKSDQTAACWGRLELAPDNPHGVPFPFSVINSGTPRWQTLDAGTYSLCGIDDQGTLSCWGGNASGQLGDGTLEPNEEPEPVRVLGPVISVTSSGSWWYETVHRCARDRQSMVWCWGANQWGQSGASDPAHPDWVGEPQMIAELGPTTVVSAGTERTCAVTTDGRSICWGLRCGGALGVEQTAGDAYNEALKPIEGLSGVPTKFVGGLCWNCALLESGEVACWGEGEHGVLGNGSNSDSRQPAAVAGLPPVRQIDGRWSQVCAVTEDGQVYCWGLNTEQQIAPATHGFTLEDGLLPTPTELPLY